MKNKVLLHNIVKEKDFLNEYQMVKQLKSNNILKERVELYRDFVVNLIWYVHTSYLGKEYIKTEADIKGHFDWAFNKVLKDFESEEIYFTDTKQLHDYFFEYFVVRFYGVDKIPQLKTFISFWDEIFNVENIKEKTIFNSMVDIYKLFDHSLNKRNILENVL